MLEGFTGEILPVRDRLGSALSFDYRGWPKRLAGYEGGCYSVWAVMDVRVRAAHMGRLLNEEQAGRVLQRVHDVGVLSIRQVESEIIRLDTCAVLCYGVNQEERSWT